MAVPNRNKTPAFKSQAEALHPRAEGLRMAFDLHEAGLDIKRQQLRRENPQLSADRIELILLAWLRREGEPGDASGHVRVRKSAET